MPLPGAVASLAINSLRQDARENRVRTSRLVRGRALRIPVVTEHAFVGNQAPGLGVMGIKARAHGPVSAALGIPAQWEFDQGSESCAMEVGSRVITSADDVVDLHVLDVGIASVEAGLPPSLVICSVTDRHRIVRAGQGVIEGVLADVVFYGIGGSGLEQRPAHAGAAIAFVNLTMALGAGACVDVMILRRGLRRPGRRQYGGSCQEEPSKNKPDPDHTTPLLQQHTSARLNRKVTSYVPRRPSTGLPRGEEWLP